MEVILSRVSVHRPGTIFYHCVQLLAYADDIEIIVRSKQNISEAFAAIKSESAKVSLAVNEGKTKYMLATSRNVKENELVAGKLIFEAAALCLSEHCHQQR